MTQAISRDDCVFCRIIQGRTGADIVFQDDDSIAFLDQRPLFLGHVLLTPRDHYETLPDLPSNLVQPLFTNAQLLAQAVKEGLGVDGTFMAINNVVSQSVPHLHVHVIPRRFGDGLRGFFWPRQSYKGAPERQEIARAIAAVFDRLRSEPTLQDPH